MRNFLTSKAGRDFALRSKLKDRADEIIPRRAVGVWRVHGW